jgi:nitrogen-specific signal transduction histidine kinase
MASSFPKVFLTLASSFALAGSTPAVAGSCPTAKELNAQILNCGQNSVAVVRARECLRILRQEGVNAANDFQRASSSCDRPRLLAAIDKSSRLIKVMRSLTDRAAHYPEAMIDISGSARKETSLECCNTSFDELQRLVAAMDREIIRVEKARLEGARTSKRCRTRARAAL